MRNLPLQCLGSRPDCEEALRQLLSFTGQIADSLAKFLLCDGRLFSGSRGLGHTGVLTIMGLQRR
jgi:hypothetical protein